MSLARCETDSLLLLTLSGSISNSSSRMVRLSIQALPGGMNTTRACGDLRCEDSSTDPYIDITSGIKITNAAFRHLESDAGAKICCYATIIEEVNENDRLHSMFALLYYIKL